MFKNNSKPTVVLFMVTAIVHALAVSPAQAVTGSIPFDGNIADTCVINALTAGELQVDATLQNLNSLAAPGTAEVTTNGAGFSLSLDTPTLTRPAADTTPLASIGGAYHATGATTVNRFDTDPPYPLNEGTTALNVYFFSGKNGTNMFAPGAYSSTMILRCE